MQRLPFTEEQNMFRESAREFFKRDAKKRVRFTDPFRQRTSTCPKSCWANSPATPSKRTRGRVDGSSTCQTSGNSRLR